MERASFEGRGTATSLGIPRLMSPTTLAALRDALATYVENGVQDSRLRPAARMVCDDARASGLRVEQMLIALKCEWAALLEQRHVPPGVARTDLTSRFITLCIHAFYASQSASRDRGVRTGDGANSLMRG